MSRSQDEDSFSQLTAERARAISYSRFYMILIVRIGLTIISYGY